MQIRERVPLFSASDLVNYLECAYTAMLGFVDLVTPD